MTTRSPMQHRTYQRRIQHRMHSVSKVADLIKMSACLCHPAQHLAHQKNRSCTCHKCVRDRVMGCRNPHKCTDKAHTRLNLIPPKHNPMKQKPPDGIVMEVAVGQDHRIKATQHALPVRSVLVH